jgi:hypothetical protein
VSKGVIGKWFLTTFPSKGSMQKLNKVPINKFTDNNILCRAEFMCCVEQIPPWCLVFGDEKPLTRGEPFNCWRCANPLTGMVKDFIVDSDWHSTYAITDLWLIGRDRLRPFSYIFHDDSNNAAVFCDYAVQNLSSSFL